MIHRSPLPDVEIPDVPLTEYVLARAAELGDKPALIDGPSGRVLTYAGLAAASRSLAGGLVAHGFSPGDVLALLAPNMPEYAVVFHAVALAGGTITTINPTYTEREVHHQLNDSGARIVVTIGLFLPVVTAAIAETDVTEIFVLGGLPDAGLGGAGLGDAGLGGAGLARPLGELMGAPLTQQVPVSPDHVVVLPYSSGTTGLNKAVMLTHRNLIANIAQVISSAQLRDDEVIVAVLPFFHIYGMQVLMNTALRGGVTIVTMPRFDLEQFLQLHVTYRATRAFVAPPIVVALAKHPIVDQFDLSSLEQIISGAAPLSPTLAQEAATRLGCDVTQGFGMTELSPVSQLTPPGQSKPGSVGVTVPNTELRIVDPATGEDLDIDADGEMWIRGPQVMVGYLNNPGATASTLDADGWLHTGDIGHVDSDGHVFVVDRLKELIKYKGFQVPPAELEAVLLTHPAVIDAAVLGRPDDEAGEVPIGFVVVRPGSEVTPEEVAAYVATHVAHYKRLAEVTIIDVIPKSASGKILRRLLRNPPAAS